MVIGGIQNFTDGFRHRFGFDCLDVLPSRKHLNIKVHRCSRTPKTDGVDRFTVVPRNVHVVRNRQNRGCAHLITFQIPARPVLLDMTAELDFKGIVGTGVKPHVSFFQPFVGHFHLPTVYDSLFENTVVVPNGETARGIAARS